MAKIANTLRRAEFALQKNERRSEARSAKRNREKKIEEERSFSIGITHEEPDNLFAARRVYFISAGGKAIKIGYSDNVMSRVGNIQTGNHEKLELLGCTFGDTSEEKRLHEKFRHHSIHYEWFHQHDEILDYIKSYCPLGDRVSLVVPSTRSPMVIDKASGLVICVLPTHAQASEYQLRFNGTYRNLLPMAHIPVALKKQVV